LPLFAILVHTSTTTTTTPWIPTTAPPMSSSAVYEGYQSSSADLLPEAPEVRLWRLHQLEYLVRTRNVVRLGLLLQDVNAIGTSR
jgi:hypothetical protein